MVASGGNLVSKLRPAFGETLWGTALSDDEALVGTVDSTGNAIVAGLTGTTPNFDARVQKLDESTGSVSWTTDIAGAGGIEDAVVEIETDAAGDVLLLWQRHPDASTVELVLIKLSGADGSEQWRTVVAASGGGNLAVVPDGDAVVSTGVDDVLHVARFDAIDGSEVWGGDFSVDGGTAMLASGVRIDPAGDVLVAGTAFVPTSFFLALKLAGSDGSELWRIEDAGGGALLAADTAGDAIFCMSGVVSKRGGGSGTTVWDRNLACGSAVIAIGGDVFVSATDIGGRGSIARLAVDTGVPRWRTDLQYSSAPGLALSIAGLVGFAGSDMWGVLDGHDGSLQIVSDTDVLCQQAEDKAGVKYTKKRLGALAKCRDAINAGTLGITPGQCPADPKAASVLGGAGRAVRSMIVGRCQETVLAGLVACDTTLNGLIAPTGDGGCFITLHDAALDAILADVYGTAPPPLSPAAAACQAEIGKGAVGYAKSYYKGRRKQIEAFIRGKPFDPSDLLIADGKALARVRTKLDAVCTDALVASLSTCAATLDGMVVGTVPGTGCLRSAVEEAVEDALLSIYDP